MAGTNSTTDGLGFEEVNQSVTNTEVISGTNVYGVNGFFGTETVTTSNITVGSITSLRVTTPTTTQGTLYSNQVGSPVSYGGIVKTGSFATTTGSVGFMKFGTVYSSTNWYASLTPTGSYVGDIVYISGAKHTSGANVIGAPSASYDYVAVGI